MENASKALIIAAAILIAIVLISLGVYVIGVGQDQIKNGGMSDIEITTFNQKFTRYDGHQKGSVIRTMVQEVMANNNSDQASEETRVQITGAVTLAADSNAQPTINIQNTRTYDVTFTYENGRVSIINVSLVNNTNP